MSAPPPLFTNSNDVVVFDDVNAGDVADLPTLDGTLHALGGNDTVVLPGSRSESDEAGIHFTDILDMGDGDDTVTGSNPLVSFDRVYGGAGDDVLVNTAVNVYGDEGDDYLVGPRNVFGGAGDDTLVANAADAPLSYFVYLSGGEGNDHVTGDTGSDRLNGGSGNDTLFGLDGDDSIHGEDGNDSVSGGAGRDEVIAGLGDDLVDGGEGADRIWGNAGDDSVQGGAGNDTIQGGEGDDRIAGGAGDDSLVGGAGADVFVFESGDGHDVVSDFQLGADLIEIDADGVETLDDVSLSETGSGDLVVAFGPGDSITVLGIGRDDAATALDLPGPPSPLFTNSNDTVAFADVSAGDYTEYNGYDIRQISALGGNDVIFLPSDPTELQEAGLSPNVRIGGGSGDDTIIGTGPLSVFVSGGTGDDVLLVDAVFVLGNKGNDWIEGSGQLNGGDGDDTLIFTASDRSYLRGEAGNDTIHGNSGNDQIHAGEDDDVAYGEGGDDYITGVEGDDVLFGGDGEDGLNGGDGDDQLSGDNGNDLLIGAAGNDTLDGGNGEDGLHGGDGDDLLRGGQSNDALYGNNGDDRLDGGAGVDYILGGAGDDSIDGGEGADQIDGGDGDDDINGQSGADFLDGGAGDDLILGGDGQDGLRGDGGDDTLDGGQDADVLVAGDGNDLLLGGDGSDVLDAGNGDDRVMGGADGDTISGGEGDDSLSGEAGRDTIYGGGGSDVIDGGDQRDFLYAGAGNDTVYGGAGNDLVEGGAGNDWLDGGLSDDVVLGQDGDDRIVLNWGRSTLDGGDGWDTLEIGRDEQVIDLRQPVFWQIDSIEAFDLTDGSHDTLLLDRLSLASVIGSGAEVRIDGDHGDLLVLDDSWSLAGEASVDGDTYLRYESGDSAVVVSDLIDVAFGSDVAAPGNSLDAETQIDQLDSSQAFVFTSQDNYVFQSFRISAGDFNGDGLSDLLISTRDDEEFLLFGREGVSGFLFEEDLDGVNGTEIGLGNSEIFVGDINNDGYDDIYSLDPDNSYNGVIFFGHDNPMGPQVPDLRGEADGFLRLTGSELTGADIEKAGDVNGDGVDDFIIGNWREDPAGQQSGSAFVVFGQADGFDGEIDLSELNGSTGFRIDGDIAFGHFGKSVSGAGDVNGDGFDDVIIGSYDGGVVTTGRPGGAYVVFGGPEEEAANLSIADLDGTNGLHLAGNLFGNTGADVSSAGDFNGDGIDDLLIAAPRSGPFLSSTSEAYVVFGTSSGFSSTVDLGSLDGTDGFALSRDAGNPLSYVAKAAGDLNQDGFDDILLASSGDSTNETAHGGAYVIYGTGDPMEAVLDAEHFTPDQASAFYHASSGAYLARDVVVLDDFDGDGLPDLAIADAGQRVYDGDAHVYVVLSGQSNIVEGSQAGDTLSGSGGDDALFGFDGNDQISGAAGDDLLAGGDGNDVLLGGAGDDVVAGGKGNDTLDGGAGNDDLTGGDGQDVFVFADGSGNDWVADFEVSGAAADRIDLTGLSSVAAVEDVMAAATATDDGVSFDFGAGHSLVLSGVHVDDLTEDHFIL